MTQNRRAAGNASISRPSVSAGLRHYKAGMDTPPVIAALVCFGTGAGMLATGDLLLVSGPSAG